MQGHPKKVVISAYKNKKLTDPAESPNRFVLPVNPEKYSQNFKLEYDKKAAKGAQGVEEKFKSSAPQELKLEFTIDGTNTIYGYTYTDEGKKEVPAQIDLLKKVVYDLSGEIHKPKLLKIVGLGFDDKKAKSFPCVLSDLQITYTLFKSDGTPLRAKISATFFNYKEAERRVREENKNSPDLTHLRKVESNVHLPLMTHRIYKNSRYYLEIAKVNNITNFRKLKAGQDLRFPPLQRTAN
ncbi:MAG: LysM peptidoglycan-binding domain-containing protein [Bacteroidota bacterium]